MSSPASHRSHPLADASDSLNQSLSITKANRHQYFETAIVSASSAEREIRQAELRGRERIVREKERRKSLSRAAKTAGFTLLVAALVGILIAVSRI